MHRRRRRSFAAARPILAAAAACVAPLAHLAPPTLAQTDADARPIPDQSGLLRGVLPNGVSYRVLRHDVPPAEATVWLRVDAGTLNESDDGRGAATFVEHMAWSGSENFPQESVTDYLSQINLPKYPPANSLTGYEQTVYTFPIPTADLDAIGDALTLLSEIAFNLTLSDEAFRSAESRLRFEINQPRPPALAIRDDIFADLFPGSRFSDRTPTLTNEQIDALTPDAVRDFYRRAYHPARVTVIVVADADPESVAQRIAEVFRTPDRGEAPPQPDPGVELPTEERAVVVTDPRVSVVSFSLLHLTEPDPPTLDTRLARVVQARNVAVAAFNDRFQARFEPEPGSERPWATGGVGRTEMFDIFAQNAAGVEAPVDRWREAAGVLFAELARALEDGFSQNEIDLVAQRMAESARTAAQRAGEQNAIRIITSLNQADLQSEPYPSARQRVEYLEPILEAVTAEEANAALRDIFDHEHPMFLLVGPQSLEGVVGEEQILSLGRRLLDAGADAETFITELLAPPRDTLLPNRPEPGDVAERTVHDEHAVTSAWLDNGVRVHVKPAPDASAERVDLAFTVAGGALPEESATRGRAEAAVAAWVRPAGAGLSHLHIQQLLDGTRISVSGFPGRDALTLRLTAPPEQLEQAFALAHLLLTEPTIETETWNVWKAGELRAAERRRSDPSALASAAFTTLMAPGDPRFEQLTTEQVERLDHTDVQAWLRDALDDAPIEAALVGDVAPDRALGLAARYLGSLPDRPRIGPDAFDDLRPTDHAQGPLTVTETLRQPTGRATIQLGYFAPPPADERTVDLLNLAAHTLTNRLNRALNDLPLDRGGGFQYIGSDAFPAASTFVATYTADPASVEQAREQLVASMARFAAEGFAEPGALQTAQAGLAELSARRRNAGGYWIQTLADLTYRGKSLDHAADPRRFMDYTAEEVRAAAEQTFTEDNYFELIILPDTTPAPDNR